jgi:RNA polymerase sigma-70 factor (ECF subfamily)
MEGREAVPYRSEMLDIPVTEARHAEVERVYREEVERLWRALLLYSGDPEIASDAAAEAFAQALRRGDALRSPGAWVWKAAFRVAAGELKRRRSVSTFVPEVHVELPEDFTAISEALARLSPKQRGAVVLHHYAGYPLKEVAEIIGSTPPAVGVHLSRARRRLRKLLEDVDE